MPPASTTTNRNNTRRETKPPKDRTTTPSPNKNKVVRDEHALITVGLAPFRGLSAAYSYLSSVKGSGIVATFMSLYCAGLSIEAVFVATPSAISKISGLEYTEDMRRQRRFMPKPHVNDGAELGRLNPWPNIQRAVLQKYFTWLPYWIRGRVASNYWTVWNSTGVLFLSITIALIIQNWEGRIWRKKPYTQTKGEFDEANSQKRVNADPNAIALAAYRAQQHNQQGMGGVLGTFIAVTCLYGLEIAAFFGSFSGAGSFVVNTVYSFLTICGFEIFEKMKEESDKAHKH